MDLEGPSPLRCIHLRRRTKIRLGFLHLLGKFCIVGIRIVVEDGEIGLVKV